jgi:hypothetical protein
MVIIQPLETGSWKVQSQVDVPGVITVSLAGAGGQHMQKRGMFIQTSTTPNPASLMFLPGQKVMEVRFQELSPLLDLDAFFGTHIAV